MQSINLIKQYFIYLTLIVKKIIRYKYCMLYNFFGNFNAFQLIGFSFFSNKNFINLSTLKKQKMITDKSF